MSKPMTVTLPFIMILLDYWPLNRFEQPKDLLLHQQLKEKLPLLGLSAVFSIITVGAQYGQGTRDLQFPWSLRCSNALVSFVLYLQKTFWPFHLAAFYPFPNHIPAVQSVTAALLILILTLSVILAVKRRPSLFVGWFWYGITIFPVLGIIPTGDFAMADRFHYLPSIGLAVMLAWGVPQILKKNAITKKFLATIASLFLLILSLIAYRQTLYWKNSFVLADHALHVTCNNFMAHNTMGIALMQQGKIREALNHFNRAIQIAPKKSRLYNNRGVAYQNWGCIDTPLPILTMPLN